MGIFQLFSACMPIRYVSASIRANKYELLLINWISNNSSMNTDPIID